MVVEYFCIRCGYTINNLTKFKNHLNRKQICYPNLADISLEDEKIKYNTMRENLEFKCICNKSFKSRQGLYLHKKVCTQYAHKTDVHPHSIDTMQKQIQELQDKVKDLQQQPPHTTITNITNNITNNNTTNNNTINNNNIVIKDFNFVDGEHVDEQQLIQLIQKIRSSEVYFDVFQKILELIYFDKNKPQFQSLYLPNVKNNICQIIKDGIIKHEDKDRVTDIVINETRNTLHDKYDEDPYRYSIMTRQTMNKMEDKYSSDDKEHVKGLKHKANLALLNSRNFVKDTWTKNNLLQQGN